MMKTTIHGDTHDQSADHRAPDPERRSGASGLHGDAHVHRRPHQGRHRRHHVPDRQRLRLVHRQQPRGRPAGQDADLRRRTSTSRERAGHRSRLKDVRVDPTPAAEHTRPVHRPPKIRHSHRPSSIRPPTRSCRATSATSRRTGPMPRQQRLRDLAAHRVLRRARLRPRRQRYAGRGPDASFVALPRRASGSPPSASSRPSTYQVRGANTRRTRRPSAAAAPRTVNSRTRRWRAASTTGRRPRRQRRLRHLPPRHEQARPAGRGVHDDEPDRRPLRRVPRAVARRHQDGGHLRRRQRRGDARRRRARTTAHRGRQRVELRHVHARRQRSSSRRATADRRARRRDPGVIATMPSAGGRPTPTSPSTAPSSSTSSRRARRRRLEFAGGTIVVAHLRSSRPHTFGPETRSSPAAEQLLPVVVARRRVGAVQPLSLTANAYNDAERDALGRQGRRHPAADPARPSRTRPAGSPTRGARWAPFPDATARRNEPMYWITVSSKRDFGTRLFGAAARSSG